MKYILYLFLVFISFNSFSGRMMFGKDQKIHLIEPNFELPLLDEKGMQFIDSSGVPINGRLGYLVETQFFIAGIWVKDGGYILTKDKETYYPITESVQKITEESINKKFPNYNLNTFDYLFGYSLWLILIGIFGYYLIERFVVNKKAQKENNNLEK